MDTVNVLTRPGVVGDGVHDDTAGLQAALDSGAGAVRLPVPRAHYLISRTLLMHPGQTLLADPEALIRLADDARVHMLTNADHDTRTRGITVHGGVWDGNNAHNPRGDDGDPTGYTGTAIDFINVADLAIRDLTVRNPEAFSIRLGEVEDFTVEDIRFDHTAIRPNQDGIHVGGCCRGGVIRNLRALTPRTTNDDMVALNADDDVERVLNLGMKRGPIRDITVEGLHADDAYTLVRLLSVTELIDNVTVSGVAGGCRLHAVNLGNWRFPVGVGNIRNVTLRDFAVRKVAWSQDGVTNEGAAQAPLVTIRLAVHNLRLEDFRREPADDLPAPTVMVDNGRRNTIRHAGTAGETTGDRFVVPRGGFSLLTVDSADTGDGAR